MMEESIYSQCFCLRDVYFSHTQKNVTLAFPEYISNTKYQGSNENGKAPSSGPLEMLGLWIPPSVCPSVFLSQIHCIGYHAWFQWGVTGETQLATHLSSLSYLWSAAYQHCHLMASSVAAISRGTDLSCVHLGTYLNIADVEVILLLQSIVVTLLEVRDDTVFLFGSLKCLSFCFSFLRRYRQVLKDGGATYREPLSHIWTSTVPRSSPEQCTAALTPLKDSPFPFREIGELLVLSLWQS